MTSLLARTSLAAIAAILVAPTPVAAQATTADGTPPVQTAANDPEIIVTANRREERVRDVAMGVSALGGENLNNRQALSFEDYAALIPGLSLQQQGTGFERLILRGQNAGTSGATVAVYIDESPIGSSNGLVRGGLLTANLDPWDLQRIEVLRGPQGTLYGASAEGGLIKFVANGPNLKQFSGVLEAGGVAVVHGEAGESIKGVLNVPLLNGDAAIRVSGFEEELPGYLYNPVLDRHNVNGGYRRGGRASFLYAPTSRFSVQLTGFIQETYAGASPIVDAVGSALTFATPPANRFDPNSGDLVQKRYSVEPATNRIENFSGTLKYDFGRAALTSVTSYGVLNERRVSPYSFAEVAPGFTYGAVLTQFFFNGTPTGLNADDYLRVHKLTQEIRFNSTGDGRLQWQFGGFYTQERSFVSDEYFSFTQPSANPFSGMNFGLQSLPSTYREYAGFGELTYKFTDRFDVAVGGRYAYNKQFSNTLGTASPLLGPALNVVTRSDGDAVTYSVAPRWHITDDTLAYARIASGYRPGGPNIVPPGAPVGFPASYGADRTQNYEVGLRTALFAKRLLIDVDVFRIDWRDIQLFEVINASGVTVNGSGARSQGVEWNFTLKPATGLALTWVGSYIDAKITASAPLAGATAGDRLPFVPDVTTSLDAEYDWQIGRIQAFAGGTLAYQDSQYTDFGASAFLEPHTSLPGFTTLSLRAGVGFDKWRLQVYGKNVADKRGITAYANAGSPNNGGFVGIIQPATFGVLVSRAF